MNSLSLTQKIDSVTIRPGVDLPLVQYRGVPIVTFAMIDEAHCRKKGTARYRFRDNKSRFIEGEDFYVVDSSQKGVFRPFGIEIPPRGLTVLTETGYLMLVKSFTDDLAWEVQRHLVKSYFSKKSPIEDQRYFMIVRDGRITITPIDDGSILTTIEKMPDVLVNNVLISNDTLERIANICTIRLANRARSSVKYH